jgi:hypothetical protein
MPIHLLKGLTRTRLFRREIPAPNARDIIVWWEVRRIPFNLLVGAAGVASVTIVFVTAFVTEHYLGEAMGLPDPPWLGILAVVAYGVIANLCFTGGWILELMSRRIWEGRADAFGEIAFLWGTLCSIALTLLPAGFIVLVATVRLLEHH